MRNLTIGRRKGYVGCLVRHRVYIEDSEKGSLKINGALCRKLGELKNGEEKTFEIDEKACRIYVINDSLTRNLYNDYYDVPAGQDDVRLTGATNSLLFAGKPFRFDNNDFDEVLQHRKKTQRKSHVFLLTFYITCFVIGFILGLIIANYDNYTRPKTFTDAGISITLTEDFTEFEDEYATVSYESYDLVVYATRESIFMNPELKNFTAEDYLNALVEYLVSAENCEVTQGEKDGMIYYKYDVKDDESGDVFTFITYVYKTTDSFWIVEFGLEKDDTERFSERIEEWAKSITFS